MLANWIGLGHKFNVHLMSSRVIDYLFPIEFRKEI
jgi:hypothetical protein